MYNRIVKMDKCRLCLKQTKKLRSLFDTEGGTAFIDMIISIANVKIQNNDGFTDRICFSCCKKLREAYDFKVCIERTDSILHETDSLKRISFNNIQDIKIKIEIDGDCKPIIPPLELFSEKLFKDGEKCISYKDTFIKKVKMDSNEDPSKESLSVIEFLKTIKADPDNNYDYEIEMDNHDLGSDSDYDPNLFKVRKDRTGKKFKSKVKRDENCFKNKKHTNVAVIRPSTPIKPLYLDDMRPVSVKNYETKMKKIKKNAMKKKTSTSVCPYCAKITNTNTMNKHILIHIGEKTFKCEMCSKAFFTLASLTKHRKKHSEAVYKCDRCVACFNVKSSLQSHMLMHSEEKNHVCDICSKAFKRNGALLRHMKIHSFGTKSFQCELCSMSFHNNSGLRHHLRVHTGERPYKCEICSQPYSYKHDFNRHCFKKHGIFLKRRSVYVMNEEVLKQERELMRDLMLRAHGILKEGEPLNPFEGPQAALAFEQAIKAIEARQIPIDLQY